LIDTSNGTRKGATVAGLLTEIKAEQPVKRRKRIDDIADQLDERDRKEFLQALTDRSIPAVAIVRVMQRRGFKLTETQVSNVRRGIDGAE
jgi:hypothetical protein